MEKEKLKQPYESARLDVLDFASEDVIATSGGFGGAFIDPDSWA
jgi:hypothetical protein